MKSQRYNWWREGCLLVVLSSSLVTIQVSLSLFMVHIHQIALMLGASNVEIDVCSSSEFRNDLIVCKECRMNLILWNVQQINDIQGGDISLRSMSASERSDSITYRFTKKYSCLIDFWTLQPKDTRGSLDMISYPNGGFYELEPPFSSWIRTTRSLQCPWLWNHVQECYLLYPQTSVHNQAEWQQSNRIKNSSQYRSLWE